MAINATTLAATFIANFASEFGEIRAKGLKGLESATKAIADGIASAHNADVGGATVLTAGVYTAATGDKVMYDPSAGPYTISAPSTPSTGDKWGVKERTNDATSITISGNSTNIEDPGTSTFVASFALATALVSYDWIFDGTNWVIV